MSHEMLFVILFHRREQEIWRERADRSDNAEGARAFAYGKMLVSQRRADDAQKGFTGKVVDVNWDMDV